MMATGVLCEHCEAIELFPYACLNEAPPEDAINKALKKLEKKGHGPWGPLVRVPFPPLGGYRREQFYRAVA